MKIGFDSIPQMNKTIVRTNLPVRTDIQDIQDIQYVSPKMQDTSQHKLNIKA